MSQILVLQAENARLREELERETGAKLRLMTQCADQLEELAAAQADANRYRWLFVEESDAADMRIRLDYCYDAWSGCDGADGFAAVVDDAMKEQSARRKQNAE